MTPAVHPIASIAPASSAWLDPAWLSQPAIRWPLTGAYILVLALVSVYGVHRYWLVWLYYRNRLRVPRPLRRFEQLPVITVQLPMFNEAHVAERIIDAAVALDYPRELLQIQVLDDSTDDSAAIAKARVEYWAAKGCDIQFLHRTNRKGYKAGALEEAMPHVRGSLIAIFDADFVPTPAFLKKTVHYFTDPGIGMVQARWGHLNRDDSLLTRSQAIFLDGHFLIEHAARNRSGRWINFNGTAGMWRRQAIENSGGWQHDTLTEDVDLSYRAQLKGWRFVFLSRLTCPAELPPEINAFKSQQHRWTKGSIQTARKLLPRLLRSEAPLGVKIEAFFHLTSPMVYLYITLMAVLFLPAFYVNMQPFEEGSFAGLIWGMSLFALGTASASTFYIASQRAQHRRVLETLAQLPLLMSIGIGIALNNARGCLEALFGHDSPFVRTPKYNTSTNPTALARNPRLKIIPTPSIKLWMSLLEILLGVYMLACARLSLEVSHPVISFPFLILFAAGYLYVGLSSLHCHWSSTRPASRLPAAPQPS